MTLSDAVARIKECSQQLDARYGKTVFDEWALVSLKRGHEKIVNYTGSRREEFQRNFVTDLGALRAELLTNKHPVGHFDFARHGAGTGFEAFVCAGDELYVICNNLQRSMDEIARDDRWLDAQQAFAELTEQFRRDPVVAG